MLRHNHVYDYQTEHVLERFSKISPDAISLAGAGVALAALRRGHVDAGKEQGQVGRVELEAGLPRFRDRR